MSDITQKQNLEKSDLNSKTRINPDLIKKIMEVQSLPEEVVIEFLKIQGSFKVKNDRKEN